MYIYLSIDNWNRPQFHPWHVQFIDVNDLIPFSRTCKKIILYIPLFTTIKNCHVIDYLANLRHVVIHYILTHNQTIWINCILAIILITWQILQYVSHEWTSTLRFIQMKSCKNISMPITSKSYLICSLP